MSKQAESYVKPEYHGVVNVGSQTHIYTNANIYQGHAVVVPRKMALAMVEDFPEDLQLLDKGVVEQRIAEAIEGLPEDAKDSEKEAKFLHKVFPTVEPEDEVSVVKEPVVKEPAKKVTGPSSRSGL